MEDRSGLRHESHGRRWEVWDGHHRLNAIHAMLRDSSTPIPLYTPKPYLTLVELPKATNRRPWWRRVLRGDS